MKENKNGMFRIEESQNLLTTWSSGFLRGSKVLFLNALAESFIFAILVLLSVFALETDFLHQHNSPVIHMKLL